MKDLDSLWIEDISTLIKFFLNAPNMSIESRLKYFHDLFPCAEKLPINIYLFDSNDIPIACNETTLQGVDAQCITDYIGVYPSNYGRNKRWPDWVADNHIKNNQLAIQTGVHFCEEISFKGDVQKTWSSRKETIRDTNGAPVGIIGFSLPTAVKTSSIHWEAKTNCMLITIPGFGKIAFPQREFSIMQGLLNGGTAQEIAKMEILSAKTVETYIMRIKTKLNCQRQRDITTLLIQHEIAKDIMKFKTP